MAQRTRAIVQVGERDALQTERARRLGDAAERSHLRSTPGFWNRAWRRFRRNRVAMVGFLILVAVLLFVAAAPLISDWTGFTYGKTDLRSSLRAPFSGDHILGTDLVGRDVLVRLAYGGRVSLLVAGLAATLTLAIGATIGATAGYFGGFIDSVLMRVVDVLLCIPTFSILILVSTLYQPGAVGLAVLLAIFGWTGLARLVRGEVLSLRSRDYVDAARVIGAPNTRVIFRHIIPNVVPLMVIWISLAIPGLILTEAALSFLGFGVRVPTPSWGNMLEDAKDYYTKSWTNVFIPGFAIYITVLAINLVGNGLRDALDPRLNE
jgi:peptide/nickel transport system permease protein